MRWEDEEAGRCAGGACTPVALGKQSRFVWVAFNHHSVEEIGGCRFVSRIRKPWTFLPLCFVIATTLTGLDAEMRTTSEAAQTPTNCGRLMEIQRGWRYGEWA